MKRRYSMMAFLLTGCLGWQSPEPAWAVGGAASAPKPNSISSQSAPQSTSLWRLAQAAQPTLADAERLYEEATQLFRSGRYEEALNRVEAALRVLERVLPSENPNIPNGFEQVARVLSQLERHDDATTYYTLALLMSEAGRGVPLNFGAIARLPQTFADNVVGQLDGRSLRADQFGYMDLEDPVLSNAPRSRMPRLPLTGGYLNIHRFEGVAGQTVNLAVTSDDFEDLVVLVFSTEGGFLAAASGSATQITLPLAHTGAYQVTVGSRTPERTGRYRLWWDTPSGGSVANAFTYQGLHQMGWEWNEGDSIDSMFTLSLPLMEAEVARLRTAHGERAPEVAEHLVLLGVVYTMLSRWADADSVYAEALNILQTLPHPNRQDLERAVEGLGGLAERRGDLAQAESYYQDALALQRTALANLISQEPDDIDDTLVAQRSMTSSLLQLAGVYQRQQRYREAEPLIAEALELADGLTDPLDRMTFLELATEAYRAQGRGGEAAEPFSDMAARQIPGGNAGDLGGPLDHPMALEQRARAAQRQGRNDEAEQLYRRAVAAAEGMYQADLYGYGVPIFYGLAGLYQAQGRIAEAIETLEAGIALEQRQFDRQLANLGEAGRQRYAASVANTLSHAVSLHLKTAPHNRDAAHLAATTLMRRKGRVLEAGLTTLERLGNNPHPEDQRLLAELDRLRQQLAAISFGESATSAQAQAQQRTLRSQIEAVDTTLARRSAALASAAPPVELADIQAHIPADGVLVEYVRYRPFNPTNPLPDGMDGDPWDWVFRGFGAPRYAAYLLKPSGEVQWADLGDATTIDRALQQFLEVLRCGEANATPCYDAEDIQPVAQAVEALVLAPLRPWFGDVTHLLLSPDGQLNLLPFAALVDDQGRYLIETYTLTQLTSGRDLLRLQQQSSSPQPPVVLANPDFNEVDTAGISLVVSASRGASRSADLANLRFGPLRGSEAEVAAIRPLLPGNAVVLTEAAATENALKQVRGPSILHLATHGFFLPDAPSPLPGEAPVQLAAAENPLLRSGLALAGFNQRDSEGEDGVLTALEVAGLDLRGTRLVVLSACETGLGDVASGEGVYGLRRAFGMAGAESQVMSLWKVSDRGTADFMAQYYERLQAGEGRSEALRQVQLAALETGRYQHPYHWAAFFFSGDWRPLAYE